MRRGVPRSPSRSGSSPTARMISRTAAWIRSLSTPDARRCSTAGVAPLPSCCAVMPGIRPEGWCRIAPGSGAIVAYRNQRTTGRDSRPAERLLDQGDVRRQIETARLDRERSVWILETVAGDDADNGLAG